MLKPFSPRSNGYLKPTSALAKAHFLPVACVSLEEQCFNEKTLVLSATLFAIVSLVILACEKVLYESHMKSVVLVFFRKVICCLSGTRSNLSKFLLSNGFFS